MMGLLKELSRRDRYDAAGVLFALAALTLGVLVIIGLLKSSLFDIERIIVVGNERTSLQEILLASGLRQGDPLIDVDQERLKDRIGAVPWVDKVAVERSWTGSITLGISEREAILALSVKSRPEEPQKWVLVDGNARQLELVESPPADLLQLDGYYASGELGHAAPVESEAAISLVGFLKPATAAGFDRLVLDDAGLIGYMDNDAIVVFGESLEMAEKVQALETVLDRVELECLGVIDVAVPSAPSIRRSCQISSPDPE